LNPDAVQEIPELLKKEDMDTTPQEGKTNNLEETDNTSSTEETSQVDPIEEQDVSNSVETEKEETTIKESIASNSEDTESDTPESTPPTDDTPEVMETEVSEVKPENPTPTDQNKTDDSQSDAEASTSDIPKTETPVVIEAEVIEIKEENSNTTDQAETKEHTETEVEHHEEEIDYSSYDKAQLIDALAAISKDENGYKKGKSIFGIKDAYDLIFHSERDAAFQKFKSEDGEKDNFEFKLDELSIKFEAYFKILKEKRVKNAREYEKQKEKNLELKSALLEKLRVFVDDDENTSSINAMKELQEEWKAIGPVHNQHNKTLWANYNALMDRYYDHRSIYFELKELDRKKNLTAKIELCAQAEALDALEGLNHAIKKLNDLHEEYKHIGPVPKANQEDTWQRFKAASDKIYAKRKDFVSHLKEAFSENYTKKVEIIARIELFASYTSDNIGEWNAKTKELLAIQKEWEAIGAMPKEKAKGANKKFWGSFKTFFHNKSAFFKTLDAQREDNLKLKQNLVDKAIEWQNNEDWDETANKYKVLQQEWKEVGAVPSKDREKIYKKFKAACDEFFNKKRGHNKDMESSYEETLKKKEDICDSLEKLIGIDDLQPEQVYELQDAFNGLGFVPKKAIKSIQNRYQKALSDIIDQVKGFDEEELNELKSLVKINKIKSGPHGDHKLQRKEQAVRRKIQHLESDISTWNNNLGFFANSKNATELLKDFEVKIKKAEEDLAELKEELKLITYVEH
jgi:hypothetical protein